MHASRSVVLMGLGLALIASGCGHDATRAGAGPVPGRPTVRPTPTTVAPTSHASTTRVAVVPTSVTTTTTAPASTTTPLTRTGSTTSAPAPPSTRSPTGPTSPALAVRGLLAAWQAGNRTAAARYATATAVRAMFQIVKEPVQASTCQPDGATLSCPYFTKGGRSFFMRVTGSGDSGYRVVDVTTSTD